LVALAPLLPLLLTALVVSLTKQSKSYKVHTLPTPMVVEFNVKDQP